MLIRWHRLGISVKGNSATALLDCEEQDTKEISRNKAQLRTDGIILYGQEIDDEAFFDVSFYFILLKNGVYLGGMLCKFM